MKKRYKLWLNLSVVTFTGLTTLSSCTTESEDNQVEKAKVEAETVVKREGKILRSEPVTPSEGEGDGEIEAEGSEEITEAK